jgi:hypothetical protein
LPKYRRRKVIEKNYDDLKNYLDMRPLRTHGAETTDGKRLCAFIALIVASDVGVKLGEYMKKKRKSKTGLFREMDKICQASNGNGWRLMNPITKTQRTIMENTGLSETDFGDYPAKGWHYWCWE